MHALHYYPKGEIPIMAPLVTEGKVEQLAVATSSLSMLLLEIMINIMN